ncbi:MAG: glycosyltransferase family 2 protein [Atopobiaceae bacterium]|nr:glycosyltransferase family 2 protein [Atopobiaceae bacterium]
MSESLHIVMPAYNESENIARTVSDWYPVVERHDEDGSSRLVVVNDGSTDDTYERLLELAKDRPLLEPLDKPNGGHGPALIYGYKHALGSGVDWVFQTDSDGQTDPAEFDVMWDARGSYDAQFGNRTERGDGKDRAFVERTLCRILRHYFGVSIPDANAPFRLMSAAYLAEYLPKLPDDYNLPNAMLSTYGVYYGRKVRFVPVSFKPRQAGTNTINVKRIAKIGVEALADFRRFAKAM